MSSDTIPSNARRAAAKTRANLGLAPDEPVDIDAVATELGCRVHVSERPPGSGVHARLTPGDGDSFEIEVHPAPASGWGGVSGPAREVLAHRRRRYAVAHEISHAEHFFERRPGRRPRRRGRSTPREELFCDEFARALLVPEAAVRACPIDATSIHAVRDQFDVSLEVAARAFSSRAHLALWYHPLSAPAAPAALVRQWASVSQGTSVHPWRTSEVVARALVDGASGGLVSGCGLRRGRPSTAFYDRGSRQLLLVLSRR
jgi:hypothetical protein